MFGSQETSFTSAQILNSVDQLAVWAHCLGFEVELGKKFCNPFRPDNVPACYLWYGDLTNKVMINDFADARFHGWDIFEAVRHQYQCNTFSQVCQLIISGFSDEVVRKNIHPVHSRSEISFLPKLLKGFPIYTQEDATYWKTFFINSSQLKEDFVHSVDVISISKNGKTKQIYPKFGYVECFASGHVKICQPYLKEHKWTSNVTVHDIRGLDTLEKTGNVLFVLKSYKDWRIHKNLGFRNCVNVISEVSMIPEEYLINWATRFKKIYIYYDNDRAGIAACLKQVERANALVGRIQFYPMWLPESLYNNEGITDNGDFLKVKKSPKELLNTIKYIIDGNIVTDSISSQFPFWES